MVTSKKTRVKTTNSQRRAVVAPAANPPAENKPVAPPAPHVAVGQFATLSAQMEDQGETVVVFVPKLFHLTLDDHRRVTYGAGVQDMPKAHAEHWYSKASGVKEHKPKKPE